MMVIFIVLPLALLITAAALAGFIWAARAGQFDDLDTPSWRVLLDDDRSNSPARSREDN